MITLKQLKSKLEKDFGWENLESDDNKWFVDNLLKDTIQAIEVIHSCKSDSEQLSDETTPKYGTKEWLIMAQEIFKKA
tara:strand:- start:78 stop:311 length:234 start_codon:yes stop_codon:yes gene_type:complete